MSDHIDEMLAQKIRALYALTQELEELLPGRHYTPDGYLIGSIGEVLGRKTVRSHPAASQCRKA